MWVDAFFYENSYLLGRSPVIPLTEFPFWAKQAHQTVNWRRVEFDETAIPDYLRDCICEAAELLYQAGQAPKPGQVIAETNFSTSWKAAEAKQGYDVSAEVRRVIYKHLSGTELHNLFIYSGVR
jgi:hypothetical protein